MLPWLPVERRWRDALVEAMLPRVGETAMPGVGELDLEPFWRTLGESGSPLLRFGLRASVWGLTLAPPIVSRRPALFTQLSCDERDEFLRRAATHRLYLVRQLVTTLKSLACFAYFHDPSVRERVRSESAT